MTHAAIFSEIALVEQVQEVIPSGASVVLLGDGEFDGTSLQQTIEVACWYYVCRTGHNPMATWDGEIFRLTTLPSSRYQVDNSPSVE